MTSPQRRDIEFSEKRARRLASRALQRSGLVAADLRLVRLGENAIFHAADCGLAVRVSRRSKPLPWVESEVCLLRAVGNVKSLSTPSLPNLDLPMTIDGHPVMMYEWLEEDPSQELDPHRLGRTARAFQAAASEAEEECEFREWDPLLRIDQRLEAAAASSLSRRDTSTLRGLRDEVEAILAEYVSPVGYGVIHGDLHPGNVMTVRDGRTYLIDFEEVSRGPLEWDAIPTVVSARRITGDRDYAMRMLEGFGADGSLMESPLCLVRELTMTTWLTQNMHEVSGAGSEVHRRIEDLRSGSSTSTWSAF